MLDILRDKFTDIKEKIKDFLKKKYGKEYAEIEKTDFLSEEPKDKAEVSGKEFEDFSFEEPEKYEHERSIEKEKNEFVESGLEEKDFAESRDLEERSVIEKIEKKIENLSEKIDLIIMDFDTIKTQEEYLKAAMKRQINILREILRRIEDLEEEHREIWKVLRREVEEI